MAVILVIDDQADIRRYLRIVLEKAGHQVQEASEGREGMRLLLGEPPDLVFCDLNMPGVDGVEFIRDAARNKVGIPIVAISGLTVTLRVAQLLGAVAVIEKPFLPQAILSAVEQHALQRV